MTMQTSVILPEWLDNLIYNRMGATYCCSNADLTVIDWNQAEILKYLGTYFPRSFAESYCIFNDFIKKEPLLWEVKDILSVFDFGCGTGGEIVGLILSLALNCPNLKVLKIKGLDGNYNALRMLDSVIEETSSRVPFHIDFIASPITIDDIYDMGIIDGIIKDKYDIIMSFKAICEFVTKGQFEERNPYQYLPLCFKKKLEDNGIILLEDVTTYNDISQEWLPKMMDIGLAKSNCKIYDKNEGYNQCFLVSHSRKKNDRSKVAWRIIKGN